MHQLAVIILAAGKGKRMGNPDLPKVLASLKDKALICYVVEQAQVLHPQRIFCVVGHQRHLVEQLVSELYSNVECTVECVTQAEQLGTGHAVMQTQSLLQSFEGDVLILSGDVPLLRAETLSDFVTDHLVSQSSASVLSCIAPDPTGYGRILRNKEGQFERIVEHRDASETERSVAEINSGIYLVNASLLFASLTNVQNSNAQGEYYLTDVIGILHAAGHKVSAFASPDYQELMGINTVAELAQAEQVLSAMTSSHQ